MEEQLHSASNWRTLVGDAAQDRDSGSWAIAKRAAVALALAAAEGDATLREAIRQLLAGQPSLAAVHNLANVVAWAASGGCDVAAHEAQAFVERGNAGARAMAAQAIALLDQHGARR